MTSILTNASAITALQSLRSVQSSLASTQKEISTGLKVSSATDNASTWSIAQTMKSDQGVLSTISDLLSVSSSVLNVATAAVTNAISVVNNIKSAVAQAAQPGADLGQDRHEPLGPQRSAQEHRHFGEFQRLEFARRLAQHLQFHRLLRRRRRLRGLVVEYDRSQRDRSDRRRRRLSGGRRRRGHIGGGSGHRRHCGDGFHEPLVLRRRFELDDHRHSVECGQGDRGF